MRIQPAWQQTFAFFDRPLVVEPSHAALSSDAGLLPLRQFDEWIALTQSFADALDDPRDPELTEHTFLEMVRSRVYGILADYEDQNDHDTLRTDPVFKLIAGRSPDDADLASQPTLSRLLEWPRSVAWIRRLAERLARQCPPGCSPVKQGPLPLFWPVLVPRNLFFLLVVLAHGFRRLLPPY